MATADSHIGEVVAGYRLEVLLGEGGGGAVYRATHTALGRFAAVKVLAPRLAHDPHFVERFFREAKVVNDIRHPNIVDIFDFVSDPPRIVAFVMELVNGRSLSSVLQSQRLTMRQAGNITLQLVHALETVHGQHVVHRDLKPDNLFVLGDPKTSSFAKIPSLKILDFGIAKISDDDAASATKTGAVLGTPRYMSPEQIFGEEITAKTDIYAVGEIFYEMVTGRPLFEGDDERSVLRRKVEPLQKLVIPPIPGEDEIRRIVRASVAVDPKDRPTAKELWQTVQGILDAQPDSADADFRPTPPRPSWNAPAAPASRPSAPASRPSAPTPAPPVKVQAPSPRSREAAPIPELSRSIPPPRPPPPARTDPARRSELKRTTPEPRGRSVARPAALFAGLLAAGGAYWQLEGPGRAAGERAVELEVAPPDARVRLDGRLVCTRSPCRFTAAASSVLELSRTGFAPTRETLALTEPTTRLSRRLTPEGPILDLAAAGGARIAIEVDGRPARTPLLLPVAAGAHTIEVRDRCFAPERQTVTLAAGEWRPLVLAPKPIPRPLRVSAVDGRGASVPAEVWADGAKLGLAPAELSVPRCLDAVELRHEKLGRARVAASGVEVVATLGPEVLVPAGPFFMGCSPSAGGRCEAAERPGRTVHLDAFSIDRREVTAGDYAACVAAGACTADKVTGVEWQGRPFGVDPRCNYGKADRVHHPMNCVSWEQASAFCRWRGAALPTEAQWEKAARGTDGRLYPWGNEPPTCRRVVMRLERGRCGVTGTFPVGSRAGASPYGARNLADNVAEWVLDRYDEGYYGRAPAENPTGPTMGKHRVARGGAFGAEDALGVTVSARFVRSPDERTEGLGFRCARSP